jgi:hypothetical protein
MTGNHENGGQSAMHDTTSSPRAQDYPYCFWSFLALAMAMFGGLFFTCMCGHIAAPALLLTGPAAVLAWFVIVVDRRTEGVRRGVEGAVVIMVSVILVKNLADVLWFGHDPVF